MKTIRIITGLRTKWPLADMAVGESLLVKDGAYFRTARTIASYYGAKLSRKYSAHSVARGLKITREQ